MGQPEPSRGEPVAGSDAGVDETSGGSAAPIVPQRACLVLPTTGEFDSRTYRIASALVQRGHVVTVMARWAPGLPARERHPAGYWVARVPVCAVDGLPLSWLRRVATMIRRRMVVRPGSARQSAEDTMAEPSQTRPSRSGGSGRTLVSRLVAASVRLLAIALTVRSQVRATATVAPTADLYHGMAYMGIPVALDLARRHRSKVVYDARDIYLEAGNLARLPRPARSLVGWIERRWARQANRVITVNRPYAELMARRFGVVMPAVVMNCSFRFEPPRPPKRGFHDRLGLSSAIRVVLYQGGFSRDRGIEQLFEAIPSVPQAVLVLMGYGGLQAEIEARCAEPEMRGRAFVVPPVPPTDLLGWVACADVVAMPIQPTTLNHRLTTPNKLFEAMAAGVPVVASDLPGMAGIVRETGCGLLVDPTDPSAIAVALRRILDAPDQERRAWGERGSAAALETFNWERQAQVLLDEYSALTGQRW